MMLIPRIASIPQRSVTSPTTLEKRLHVHHYGRQRQYRSPALFGREIPDCGRRYRNERRMDGFGEIRDETARRQRQERFRIAENRRSDRIHQYVCGGVGVAVDGRNHGSSMAAGWRLDRRTRSTAGWRGWRLEQQEASRLRRFLGLDCPTNLHRAVQPHITNLWIQSMLGFRSR